MGRFGKRQKEKADPKKRYDLISKDTDEGLYVYELIRDVREEHAKDLTHARIGAAWIVGKRPDKDGRVTLGKMKKAGELEKSIHHLDALILLNQDAWRRLLPNQRVALIHHELCHLSDVTGPEGEALFDGHGERRWRIVKHDIEEFRAVVHAHGCYTSDLASLVRAATEKDPQMKLFNGVPEAPVPPAEEDAEAPTPKPKAKLRAVK